MRKSLFLILAFLIPAACLQAQTTDEASVTEVIHKLFTAMSKADSSMLRSVFESEVTMATAMRNKEGKPVLRREYSINDFVKSIGTAQPGSLSEEIWNLKIQIDGEFAQAWCDYAFYYNNKFLHCGVDAFQLYKGA